MADIETVPHPARRATLYRMVMREHVCPFGVKARWLLRRRGYAVDDRLIRSREEQEAIKARFGVKTTPQVFIEGRRIGGYDDLRRHFGLAVRDPNATSYAPVIAVFAVAATIALATLWHEGAALVSGDGAMRFGAVAMMLLAMLKLQDVDRFATMFLGYDLLAQRLVPYAYAYPILEFGAGAMMLGDVGRWVSGPVALAIGAIGAVSVVKAVWIDRRDIKCACVGGGSRVPLGFVSLSEDLVMAAMGIAVCARAIA